jgi:hypothetical protein
MDICENKDGGNYWGCFGKTHEIPDGKKSPEPFFQNWHCVLPPRAKKIAEAEDREFIRDLRKRRKEAEKQGKKPPERAFRIRAIANAKRIVKA